MLRVGSRRNGWSPFLRWPRSWCPRPLPRASVGAAAVWEDAGRDAAKTKPNLAWRARPWPGSAGSGSPQT